ncbi:flagellar hook-length control protein FliK [Ramlibacter sp. MMS24-I3-19]|uniref:flagellar hook-length control protein FliK n=1 Tax=Ramlibacter sp. MMS24-I3-19 TaxID=3416606 RepID=UPI003D00E928
MSTTASVSASHAAAKSSAASAHATGAKGASGKGADAFAAVLQALGAAEGGELQAATPATTDVALPAAADDSTTTPVAADATTATPPAAMTPLPDLAAAMQAQAPNLPAAMLAMAGAHALREGAAQGKHAAATKEEDDALSAPAAGTSAAAGATTPHGMRAAKADPGAVPVDPAPVQGPAASSMPAAKAELAAKTAVSTEAAPVSSRAAHELAPALLAGAHAPHVQDAPQSAPAMPVHQAALPSHPLDAAFAGDLAAEVQVMAGAGLQRAELQLHPADLGPVRIELAITAQTADLQFHAANATTREGLENALPQLREALAASGLQLGQASVGSGAQPQADANAWRDQQARAQQSANAQGRGPAGGGATGPAVTTVAVRRNRGLLDLYA